MCVSVCVCVRECEYVVIHARGRQLCAVYHLRSAQPITISAGGWGGYQDTAFGERGKQG